MGRSKVWPQGVQRNAMDVAMCKSMTINFGWISFCLQSKVVHIWPEGGCNYKVIKCIKKN